MIRWLVALLAASVLTPAASAHQLKQSYVYLRVYDEALEGRAEMGVEDVNLALGLSLPTDDTATDDILADLREPLCAFWSERLSFTRDGRPMSLEWREVALAMYDRQYVTITFGFPDEPDVPETVGVRFDAMYDMDPEHVGMILIEYNWRDGTLQNESEPALIFTKGDGPKDLDLTTTGVWRGIRTMIGLGVHHIWIGLDHILFLMALLLPAVIVRREKKWEPAPSFKSSLLQVVKIVTLFTIAHSITLSVAALEWVVLSSRLVESIIALSIAIAAAAIILPLPKAHGSWVVLLFGLFHGFGFASVLGDYGIRGSQMALSLLGFNIGVELGQLAIVAGAFPVLYILGRFRLYTRFLVYVGALGLIFISLYWFVERGFEIDLPAGEYVNKFEEMITGGE